MGVNRRQFLLGWLGFGRRRDDDGLDGVRSGLERQRWWWR